MNTSSRVTLSVGLRSDRGPVLLALLLCMALVALDSTIIATAVPSIVGSIGGFRSFPWLFSSYLLAQAVTVPVYGKLADILGRKPTILLGIGLFLAGSTLGGLAPNMSVLIAARCIQGLGAGAVQPVSMTIVGDVYSLPERAKVQGYIASVWGGSAVLGPALGGLLTQYASWRWIFFVNIPICVVAASMIRRRLGANTQRVARRIDYVGVLLLTAGLTLLVLGALEGGQAWAWGSATSAGVLGGGSVLIVGFAATQRRAADPVLPQWVVRHRLFLGAGLASFGIGGILLGLSSYIPTFAQDVLGVGPLVAGFSLAPLTAGWAIAASQSGRVYLRVGMRLCALIGSVFVVTGSLSLLAVGRSSAVTQIGATCCVVGVGMGLVSGPVLIAAQMAVRESDRGVVTGTNLFWRSLGGALCAAVYGALTNGIVQPALGDTHDDPARLTAAVHQVFLACVVLSVVIAAGIATMPRNHSRPGRFGQPPRAESGPKTCNTRYTAN